MRAFAAALLLAAATTAQPTAQADKAFLAVMGFPWTASEQQIKAAVPGFYCTLPGQLCFASEWQVQGVRMSKVTFFLSNGRLQSISMDFEHRAFGTLKKYFIGKYGRATVTNPPSSDDPDLIWTGRAVDLYLDNARSEPKASVMFVVIGTGSPAERRRR